MRKHRGQFSLRRRHFALLLAQLQVQKARAFRVRVLCASLWLSVEIYQYADGAHESLFLKFGFMANAVAFFLPRRRIISGPGSGSQSRYQRISRPGYGAFPSSVTLHTLSQQPFNWNVNGIQSSSPLSFSVCSTKWHIFKNNF